jgi:hypothetical protein
MTFKLDFCLAAFLAAVVVALPNELLGGVDFVSKMAVATVIATWSFLLATNGLSATFKRYLKVSVISAFLFYLISFNVYGLSFLLGLNEYDYEFRALLSFILMLQITLGLVAVIVKFLVIKMKSEVSNGVQL